MAPRWMAASGTHAILPFSEKDMQKQEALRIVESLPDEVDVDELLYRFYVSAKLDVAEKDVRAGNVLMHNEVVRRSAEWFK